MREKLTNQRPPRGHQLRQGFQAAHLQDRETYQIEYVIRIYTKET